MIISQCVVITLAAALVLVHTTSSTTTMPATTVMETTTTAEGELPTATTSPPATKFAGTAEKPATSHYTGTTEKPATSNYTGTSAESSTPNVIVANTLSNVFVFTSTWIIVTTVGGFAVLTAMPLVIIMILIVALGCVCKKYKRLKKRLTRPAENVASNDYAPPATTTMDSDVLLRNVVILDDIDTGNNVAYGRTSTVTESCDNTRKNSVTIPGTETDRHNYEGRNSVLLEDIDTDGNVAYGRISVVIEDQGNDTTMQDTAEDDGDTDYVINDMYASIDT